MPRLIKKSTGFFVPLPFIMRLPERFKKVIDYFSEHVPSAETELNYTDPYQLLVAVILSAQCTDKRVNMVTPGLFERFPEPESLALASPDEIFTLIRSVSYPNNKARHLSAMAKMLVKEFHSSVPDKTEDLQKLPGVGRKTANVVASVIYNQPRMAVDTHVFRVAARLGLTQNAKNPLQAEKQLIKYLPESIVAKAHHWLILHGRYICKARRPLCEQCGLTGSCKYFEKQQKSLNQKIH